ncbi:MAG: hypothetical protein J6V72_03320 [Kiritimatiellae bacterium]|nr:hypothetical protein [Kiritimatiellia bacterium]
MTFILQTLVQGAVGFAVGAGTNDLAIRWIFKTIHRKKLVLGKAIQDVISTELMSPDSIIARLASPDVREMLERNIREAIDRHCVVEYPSINEIVQGNPVAENAVNDGIERLASRLADDFVHYYTEQDARVKFVRSVFGKVRGVLGPLMPDIFGMILRMPELQARVRCEMARALQGFAKRPVGRINRIIDPSARIYLASLCADAFSAYLSRNLPVLLRQLKIWDLIHETIASFDMNKIEGVTRRIINAELRGVTLWGGVIGLIVGISQSLVLWLLK